jgi:hypothetical protein
MSHPNPDDFVGTVSPSPSGEPIRCGQPFKKRLTRERLISGCVMWKDKL